MWLCQVRIQHRRRTQVSLNCSLMWLKKKIWRDFSKIPFFVLGEEGVRAEQAAGTIRTTPRAGPLATVPWGPTTHCILCGGAMQCSESRMGEERELRSKPAEPVGLKGTPWRLAKSGQHSALVNRFCWNPAAPDCLGVISGSFQASMTALSSFSQQHLFAGPWQKKFAYSWFSTWLCSSRYLV